MRFKQDVLRSFSNIEMVCMNEATRIAELLNNEWVSYEELIQLQEYFSMTRPEYYKVLFDMIEECLLRINLQSKEKSYQ